MIKKRIKIGIIILIVLIIAAAAWYARPVSIYTLLDGEVPDLIGVSVESEAETYQNDYNMTYHDMKLNAGTPELDALMTRLESLRFHRSPFELLYHLSNTKSSVSIDVEKDYTFFIDMYNKDGELIEMMQFWIAGWYYGPACRLPLYVFNGQEKGRELGTWLWEMAQETEANP